MAADTADGEPMTPDLDLDAIQARFNRIRGFDCDAEIVLSLVSAIRRETEARKDAEEWTTCTEQDRDSWKARAVAAEAIAKAFYGVSAEDCGHTVDALRGKVDGIARVGFAINRLATVLRDRERSAREGGGGA